MAVIAIVEADYNQCAVLERFLGSTFPKGGASVKHSRGLFRCRMPRSLNMQELEILMNSGIFEHYREE